MLKCIAFDDRMTELDLKAIYRRRKEDNWGAPILDADGREQWDATGPLPMLRHSQWTKKGFVYITLADEASLQKVIGLLNERGENWRDYMQDRQRRSPWNAALWLQGEARAKADEYADLRELVKEFGPDAVTKIKQRDVPGWTMPASILESLTAPTPSPSKGKAA